MQTALTRLLGTKVPIVVAPMAGAAGGKLAAAAIRAGAFGFIAGGHTPVDELQKQVEIGRHELGLTKDDPLPFGIGLICWKFESPHGDSSAADAFLKTIIDSNVAAVWLSFGAKLKYWVDKVRQLEKEASSEMNERKRMFVFVAAGSVDEALEMKEWEGVDVVTAQGLESGGHGPTYQVGLPTISLIPTLAPHFAPTVTSAPLLLAAGGIATGSQLVASLALGASGAVMGTAFLPTQEATYSTGQKKRIVGARGEETIRSMNFDHARGTLGWGTHVDGRGLRNSTTDESVDQVSSEEGKKKYAEAVKKDDTGRIIVWAGTSVSLVGQDTKGGEFATAEMIVQRITKEAQEALGRLTGSSFT